MRGRHKQGALPTNRMHSMWEFVFVAQFLRVFQGKFGFVNFTTEELENAFLESSSSSLWAIFYDLVRILLPKRDIKKTTWQDALKEECEKRTPNWKPFDQGKRYETFSPEERVLLFKHLIVYLADGEDKELKEFVKDFLNPDSTKVKPVGRDANNNVYWYFDDTRLYREVIGKKGQRSGWETVCLNLHDWDKLLSTFQKSTNSNEKKLYRYLKNELYPAVMPLAKEDDKETKLDQSQDQTSSKHKTERDAMVAYTADKVKKRKVKDEEIAGDRSAEEGAEEEDTEEEEEEEEEEDNDLEENSDIDEEFDPADEEDSPPPQKRRKPPPTTPPVAQRKRGRPAGSRAGALDQQKVVERRRKRSVQDQEQMQKDMQERKELEQRVEEEIQKQESLMTAAGVESRTKRRCVIMREKMNKKKEWWEEEGLGSESEEDNERDIDSDSSDGPRRRRKVKLAKPVEMPDPPNRIYVFSTALANRAAEAIQMRRVESITAFHRAQPSSSPFLKLEQSNSMNFFGKQKTYYPQQYPMRGSAGGMGQMSGFSGMPGGMHVSDRAPNAQSGYGTSQWEQMPAQQPMFKDRQRQAQSQAMDDIHQLLFGSSQGGNNQTGAGVNGMYSRGGYNQQGRISGDQSSSPYPGYPRGGPSQHQAPYVDRRSQGATQQASFPAFSQPPNQQQQQQQQAYFQRPRNLGNHPSQGNSPSSDPLGAGVRSPPPPYPGSRPSDSRHSKNSPVPSPTSTGSPHTPQTPLTPQTPRFPGPSPSEPSKPPFSPSHPQGSMSGPSVVNYNVQTAQTGQALGQGDERPMSSQPRPGFIELSNKTLSHGLQNPYASGMANYNQAQSPLDGRRPDENKSPAFGSHSNQGSPLHSPTDHAPPSHFANSAPPNKSLFARPVGQPTHNHSPFASSGSAAVQASKSFSVESLTAPSQPPLDKSSIPPTQLSEQPMPQYSGLYFPSNKYSPMFGQPQYQYPGHMQHPAAFYNSQLTPNMYLGRAPLPMYPPNRDSGL